MSKIMLSTDELDFIIESLNYTKQKFEEYDKYPTYAYKRKRLDEVENVLAKVYAIRKEKQDN